jgi:hypothetical protein
MKTVDEAEPQRLVLPAAPFASKSPLREMEAIWTLLLGLGIVEILTGREILK